MVRVHVHAASSFPWKRTWNTDLDADMDTEMDTDMDTDIDTDIDTDMGRTWTRRRTLSWTLTMDTANFHKCLLSRHYVCRDVVVTLRNPLEERFHDFFGERVHESLEEEKIHKSLAEREFRSLLVEIYFMNILYWEDHEPFREIIHEFLGRVRIMNL